MLWTDADKETFLASLLRRLEAHVRVTGESEAQFARRLGSSEALFKNLRKGSFPSLDRLHALLLELGETLVVGAPHMPADESDDLVHIPLHAAELAAGVGAINSFEEVTDYLAFKRAWLRRMGISPHNAVLARVRGNSMSPTISDQDIVLIDTGRREIPPRPKNYRTACDPVYAVMVGDEARVKRISYIDTNLVALISDNPDLGPEFKNTADPDTLRIVGRVMWWGHSEKLP